MDIPSPSNLSFPSRLNIDRRLFSKDKAKIPLFNFLETDGLLIRDWIRCSTSGQIPNSTPKKKTTTNVHATLIRSPTVYGLIPR